jgi:hypothetical protein
MADPMAALAVARIMARAAINTVSERDNASFDLILLMGNLTLFGSRFRFVYLA